MGRFAFALAWAVASGVVSLAAAPAGAQEAAVLPDSGARIRVLRAGDRVPQEAALVSFGRDTLVFQPGGCCVVDTIPVASLTAVDVSRGVAVSPNRLLGGMAFGFLAGAGAGWAIGGLGCRTGGGELCAIGVLQWTTILGAAGLVTGALWGLESKTERWEPIYQRRHASISVAPNQYRGFSLGVVIPLDTRSVGELLERGRGGSPRPVRRAASVTPRMLVLRPR